MAETASCPKCGFERQPAAVECPACGIIYARFDPERATHRRLATLIDDWAAEHGRAPALPAADLAIVAKALTNGLALERDALPDGAADELLVRALRALAS